MTRVLDFRLRPTRAATFYVYMTDDSLAGIGIHRHDTIEVRRSSEFNSGDLIVFTDGDGDLFVMYAHVEPGGTLRCVGAHPQCPVRRYRPEAVRIEGVVVGNEAAESTAVPPPRPPLRS